VKLKLVSETVGTFFLVLVVVGSGIMGENLTSNKAIVLLANSTATFLGLTVHMYIPTPHRTNQNKIH
jgi:glycerol uptake facilitator-like aquaporin